MSDQKTIQVGLIGVGGVADYVHYPGFKSAPNVEVSAIFDPDSELLAQRATEWEVDTCSSLDELLNRDEIDAVAVATPNFVHAECAIAAFKKGKHVICEKPLAMNLAQAHEMLDAARASGARHMTAFTYRFVPGMRYLKHLIDRGDLGEPRHFRAQRFQDWGNMSVGWRQYKDKAGTGELGDMASHRLDYGRYLLGEITSVCGAMKHVLPRDRDRDGNPIPPSDTDDWVAVIGEFESGVTGVWESTKLATGHKMGGISHDFAEINGSEATAIYQLNRPYEIKFGTSEKSMETVPVPKEFWKLPESLRVAGEGDSAQVWRWDQEVEFIRAIREGRDCEPSFADGTRSQAVMEAVLQSVEERRWVEVERR
tara:strand:- start:235 stop:1338 length:1104 start_codon:yes stop_codon:yes gene_type:complete